VYWYHPPPLPMSLDYRLVAKEYAQDVLKELRVPSVDAPYVEAVIVEALMFEEPIKNLRVAVDGAENYTITIQGYQNLVDMVRWVNTFLGANRDKMLCHVTRCFWQPSNNTAVILMNKIRFVRAEESAKKGAADDGSEHVVVRRYRKRTE
jgi:hypothetical protein